MQSNSCGRPGILHSSGNGGYRPDVHSIGPGIPSTPLSRLQWPCRKSTSGSEGFGLTNNNKPRTVVSVITAAEGRLVRRNNGSSGYYYYIVRPGIHALTTRKGRSSHAPHHSMKALPGTKKEDQALEEDEEEGTTPAPPNSNGSNGSSIGKRGEMTEGKQPWKRRERRLFGVEMTPDTVAIATVYFVQGILGLSRLAVSFFLKDDLHLDPAETALLTGFSAIPWLIKPLYGFVSDGLPLFGYRRRSYLVLCGLLGAGSWGALATVVDDKYGAVLMILLSSLSVAFSDVVVDSMVVERARGESQSTSGSLQSLCWGSAAVGGIVSAYFSGYFVQSYGVKFVFGVTALLPLITSGVAGLVNEKPTTSLLAKEGVDGSRPESLVLGFVESSRKQIGFLWQTVKEPNILLPTLFIFVWQATPTSDTAMFFFTTNKLGFGPEFLGRVRLVTSVASLAGVALYNQLLKGVPLWKMFFWTTCLGSALGFTQLMLVTGWNRQLGISDEWFAMGDSLVLTVLGQVSFMPVLVLAAKLCPPGLEATLFATLMSISNGGGVTGGVLGAWLTGILGVTSENFNNLAMLIVLCNVSSLVPLPFLGFLPSETDLATAVEEAETALSESSKAD